MFTGRFAASVARTTLTAAALDAASAYCPQYVTSS